MATFFITAFVILFVRKNISGGKPRQDDFNFFREFKEGIRSITEDKGVKSLVVLMGFMCFFVAFLQTLMIPMALAFADARTVGIMESISAVGMLAGSIIIGVLNIKKNYTGILTASLMTGGLFMTMIGMKTSILWIISSCFLFFTSLPFINTCADVLIRIKIPNDVQGRAWGMISVLTQSGYVAAYAVCGLLADYVFEPMLMEKGVLSGSIGLLIGTGAGRGIGFMFMIVGIMMFGFAFFFGSKKSICEMEKGNLNELV